MSARIQLAPGLSLPVEVSTQKIALLAQSGRGKTRASKKLVEGFVGAGVQTIVLDPVGVWYGLRLAADGKSPGLAIPVLGGYHGDAPLLPTAGAVVAETLARTGSSVVLDMTRFDTGADARRFITAFAETFFRAKAKHPSPVHLVLEEADEWVPQNPAKDEAKMLGAFQRIARIGRNFGIGFTVISQRPQGISKKVLNLTDMLVVLGMSGNHERKAIAEWMVDKDIDSKQREAALASLPGLGWNKLRKVDNGALFWAPLLELFGTHKISAPTTYDSSATPETSADRVDRKIAPLDIGKLSDAMHATIEEAEANDPSKLRKRVAQLERELHHLDIKNSDGLVAELNGRVEDLENQLEQAMAQVKEVPVLSESQVSMLQGIATDTREAMDKLAGMLGEVEDVMARSLAATMLVRQQPTRPTVARPVAQRPTSPKVRPLSSAPSTVGKGERVVLTAIAQHPEGVSREQLSVLTAYKRSTRDRYIQLLAADGLINVDDSLTVTDKGLAELGDDFEPLPTGNALRGYWLNKLTGGEQQILALLCEEYPAEVTRGLVDASTGFKRSTRDRYLQLLAARKLIEVVRGGNVRASDMLFDTKGAA
jgi:hypothetical protein